MTGILFLVYPHFLRITARAQTGCWCSAF